MRTKRRGQSSTSERLLTAAGARPRELISFIGTVDHDKNREFVYAAFSDSTMILQERKGALRGGMVFSALVNAGDFEYQTSELS
jgi:hypothetical protein